jgi:carboxyl-terminal processing protease
VISAIDDTPAARADIRGGDIITEVNGNSIGTLTLSELAETLRGPVGTKVQLELIRQHDTAPIALTLTRQIVTLQSVQHQVEGNDVGYIRISQFGELTTGELQKTVGDLSRRIPPGHLQGYILDFRNDPGGLLDQAVPCQTRF